LSEDTDDAIPVKKGYRAHFDCNQAAVGAEKHDTGVGNRCSADNLSREELAGAQRILGRNYGSELPPANVADDVAGSTIQPADYSGRIDDVTRDVEVLQHLVEI
jgi:hypothetical protein